MIYVSIEVVHTDTLHGHNEPVLQDDDLSVRRSLAEAKYRDWELGAGMNAKKRPKLNTHTVIQDLKLKYPGRVVEGRWNDYLVLSKWYVDAYLVAYEAAFSLNFSKTCKDLMLDYCRLYFLINGLIARLFEYKMRYHPLGDKYNDSAHSTTIYMSLTVVIFLFTGLVRELLYKSIDITNGVFNSFELTPWLEIFRFFNLLNSDSEDNVRNKIGISFRSRMKTINDWNNAAYDKYARGISPWRSCPDFMSLLSNMANYMEYPGEPVEVDTDSERSLTNEAVFRERLAILQEEDLELYKSGFEAFYSVVFDSNITRLVNNNLLGLVQLHTVNISRLKFLKNLVFCSKDEREWFDEVASRPVYAY